MRAQIVLHVREHPDGSAVVVTPVQFADLTFGADSYAAAVEALGPRLASQIGALEPVDRLLFLDEPDARLYRISVEVPGRDKAQEPIAISLGVVVLRREAGGRSVYLAYAPVLSSFEHLQSEGDPERVAERAAQRAARKLKSWSPGAVVAADEPADSRLEVIEVELASGGRDGLFEPEDPSPPGILEEFGVDLTQREGGRIDRRDELVRRALETLSASDRSSLLLVGPPDVGKTALVHEIAGRIARGEAPAALDGRRVWRISANELIAGAQYTGQWQERARRLIEQARATGAIVVMGDPVGIIDAGRWAKSDNNVSRFLRPYVESGEITLVCECTIEQYQAAKKEEPSFIDAFHRIDVLEPDATETFEIASAAAGRLAATAAIEITPDAVAGAVELTRRFESYRSFPGKTVRLLEDAVRERDEGAASVGREEITVAFARRTGLPLALLADSVPLNVDDVRLHFETCVLGQPEATETMVDVISVLKAGLNDPAKPLASFFFVGPTGVGKTELAKALAEFLFGSRDRVIRLDLGEYASADAVQRLIGTAWGTEGELPRRVRQQPFCVVLLDEIEKAHWSVFDALLAALGEGRLTDASGRTADFRNAIVIMTSNLGASRSQTSSLGFTQPEDGDRRATTRYVEEAEAFFRPEFFNRIDRIVVFHALGTETVKRIARRELRLLLEREGIVRRGLRVEVDDEVVDFVATKGFHPRYGARPLQREIERNVIQPLARLLLKQPPQPGDFVRVHLAGGAISVRAERVREQAAARRRERRTTVDEAQFARLERATRDFLQELREDAAAKFVDEVQPVMSRLLDSTHQPSFWNDADRARTTLQRIYRLEQAVDRFTALEQRAIGLVEFAKRLRETRARSRTKEVTQAIAEMQDRLLVLRLELAAAAAGAEGGAALLRVVPVGSGSAEWAEQLIGMYARWAERTGRDVTVSANGSGELRIDGLATLDLLSGETGLHRHVNPDRTESLVRVVVASVDGSRTSSDADPGLVVRVYEEGKRRLVRDPRTDARESHVASVLTDGRIDSFLIAWLRQSR